MGAPALLITVVGGVIAVALMIIASMSRNFTALKVVVGVAAFWVVAYFGLLLFASITSKEKVLEQNEAKEFCGFYLDCHLHVAVAGVSQTKTLGTGPSAVTAAGKFYLVTVRVLNDAKRSTIALLDPQAFVTDNRGRRFSRVEPAEALLTPKPEPFDQMVSAGGSFTKQLVFDIPDDAVDPMLQVNEGYRIDRWLETFLIGDEDSLMHKPVKLRLN